jgi:1,4-alpha-glucan branching enzyme
MTQDPHRRYKHGHGSDEQHKQDQALFSELLEKHQQIQRQTQRIENGIRATTTARNAALGKVLQEHVIGMEKRFGMGRAIRSWDPLFAALFEYKEQIQMQYKLIENGVEATLTSEDPKMVELIHAHDLTLHGFVDQGFEAGGRESPKPSWLE